MYVCVCMCVSECVYGLFLEIHSAIANQHPDICTNHYARNLMYVCVFMCVEFSTNTDLYNQSIMDFEAFEDLLLADEAMYRLPPYRVDPFEVCSENEFQRRYRLKKETVLHLLSRLGTSLEPNRNHEINARQQLLMTLRLLSGCTLQLVCSDLQQTSQSSVSRIFKRVVEAICSLRGEFIRMPANITAVKNTFFEYGGFPGVIGCVDGTHIAIIKPRHYGDGTEIFRCRKGYYSINTQILCGPEYLIYNVVAKWPGSTHDSRVFDNSTVRHFLEENNQGVVLADSGYPCRR
jgi:nuclease HARBI1